jgi:hypothetical protein
MDLDIENAVRVPRKALKTFPQRLLGFFKRWAAMLSLNAHCKITVRRFLTI